MATQQDSLRKSEEAWEMIIELSNLPTWNIFQHRIIKGTLEKVIKIFKPFNIKLSNKPTNTSKKNFCHLEDERSPQEKANVVY